MNNYRVGDFVDVRLLLTEAPDRLRSAPGRARVVSASSGEEAPWSARYHASELDLGTLVKRPIAVGDKVRWGAGQIDATVLCIDDDRAWIKFEGDRMNMPLSALVRA